MGFQENWNMKRNIFINNKAFSLLEMTIVIIIMIILASAAIPVLSRAYLEKAGTKTALDINAIQDAARAYYINNNAWPGITSGNAMGDLTAGNYLPSGWNAINPFGFASANPSAYSYNVSLNGSSNGSSLIVSTYVPTAVQPIIQNLLPINWVSGNMIFSSVTVPGESSILPTGTILPWASNNLPAGFLWCNGQVVRVASYQNLYNIIGSIYDVPGDGSDGVNTFSVPDMMGRTIVGVDGMGGASLANRITLWGTLPATVGGTFGESSHTLAMAELPASAFNVQAFMANGSHQYGIQGSNNGANFQTASSGMNLGNGVAHNVVQPSIAMGYIIKY
jgi:microcystin-dependent protein/type II secretory pathway pseudopilin PulG